MTDRLTKEQGAILTAFTGLLCGKFSDFAAYAERLLNRPIWTHQFPSLADEIKEAARADFMTLVAEGDTNG